MSKWFWNMYHCARMIGLPIHKALRMAWSARHGPDPKVIEAARFVRRASLPKGDAK